MQMNATVPPEIQPPIIKPPSYILAPNQDPQGFGLLNFRELYIFFRGLAATKVFDWTEKLL